MENKELTDDQKVAIEAIVSAVERAFSDVKDSIVSHCEKSQVPFIGIDQVKAYFDHYAKTYRISATGSSISNPNLSNYDKGPHDDLAK